MSPANPMMRHPAKGVCLGAFFLFLPEQAFAGTGQDSSDMTFLCFYRRRRGGARHEGVVFRNLFSAR